MSSFFFFAFTGHSRCAESPTILRQAFGHLFPLFKHDDYVGVLESGPGTDRGCGCVYSAFRTLRHQGSALVKADVGMEKRLDTLSLPARRASSLNGFAHNDLFAIQPYPFMQKDPGLSGLKLRVRLCF